MQHPDTEDGLFHSGNPLTGEKGTPIPVSWLNALLQVPTVCQGITSPPAADLGYDGDLYIDTVLRTIYGPKAGGEWGDAWALGIPGIRGGRVTLDHGAPGLIAGQLDGDLYFDLDTWNLYFLDNVWVAKGCVRGGAGQQGPAGTAQNPFWADVIAVDQAEYDITGYDCIYRVDTTDSPVDMNFPTAVGKKGRRVYVENIGAAANDAHLNGLALETIEGQATVDLGDGVGMQFYSDGANWYRLKP